MLTEREMLVNEVAVCIYNHLQDIQNPSDDPLPIGYDCYEAARQHDSRMASLLDLANKVVDKVRVHG